MKIVKVMLKVAVVLAALIVVALLTLPVWFGPVVKTAANSIVPGVVKTDFRMGYLSLNPYTGRVALGETQLSNPKGYSEQYAMTLGEFVFDCDPLSLSTDVIHIEEIKVTDVFVSVTTKDGVMNFKQIQYNAAGGKEKYEAEQQRKESEKAGEDSKQAAQEAAQKGTEKPEKKIIIDKLEIAGLKLQIGFLPIALPSVTLTDIGRKDGGATLEDAWQQIVDGVLRAAGVVGDQAKMLLGSVGDMTKQATEALGNVTDGATKAAGKATEAIGNVTGDATKAATQAAGKTVDAVEEGAKKAVDALKSLW